MKTNVSTLCRWLSVSRAGYYKWLNRPSSNRARENETLQTFLKKISEEEHCIPGYRKLWQAAIAHGFICNRKRVQRLLQGMGYRSRASKRKHGRVVRQATLPPCSNLLSRKFDVKKTNTVWVSDITQVRCKEGWSYLCVILDLFSRKVISWKVSQINNADLVLGSLKSAWRKRQPDGRSLLFHSDQGIQFRAKEVMKWHAKKDITVSMSRKGNCWDNACAESFFAQYKKEWISNLGAISREEMKAESFFYIENYYNCVRKHGTLNGLSPMLFEQIN